MTDNGQMKRAADKVEREVKNESDWLNYATLAILALALAIMLFNCES